MNDLISVIVPVYKVEPYLDKCISSIVNQTYKNLEVILVDDGSPDNCPSMCDAWAEKDSRIRVIHKTNGGLSDARNAGLAVATGSLISFIDSDDWIEPEFFVCLFEAMAECNADVAECATQFVDENGRTLRTRKVATENIGRLAALRRLVLEDGVYQTVWDKLYRREIIQDILFEVGKYNEDEFWTDQVLMRANSIAFVSTPLYNYLQRGGSIIGTGYNMRRLDGLDARFQRMQRLQEYSGLADLTRQQFILDCMWHLQCTYRCLTPEEAFVAQEKILGLKEQTPRVAWRKLTLNLKYKLWYTLFQAAPVFAAKLRNWMKIGL